MSLWASVREPASRVVVIVAYGGADLLEKALLELGTEEQVVLVDNSSSRDVEALGRRFGVRYLDPGRNGGFASGVNVALRDLAQRGVVADVLLLNPDARIGPSDIDKLQRLLRADGNERVAAVAPSLRGADGSAQRVRWPFPSPAAMWREAIRLVPRNPDSGFVVGAVLLLRHEAIADVGLFDERFFLYAEETDWQRRAADRGWRSVEVPDVVAHHVGAAMSEDPSRRDALFQAGQETYVRKWFGVSGWWSYRIAALLAAGLRAVAPGAQRRAARPRLSIYLRGPRKVAGLRSSGPLRIVHLVVTANAAGTERYVADVAAGQAQAGHVVTVVGGDAAWMRAVLPAQVRWFAGPTLRCAAIGVLRAGRADVVHSHLTAADLLAVVLRPLHGATVVSTRHIAKPRGATYAARVAALLLQRGIARDVCISEFVRTRTGRPGVVLHNGVPGSDASPRPGARTIVVAQRIEPEKATGIALEAWERSGLAERGWTLRICGDGSQRAELARDDVPGVEWRGWVDDMRTVFLDAAALLAPAPGEPFGLSVVEAMGFALPVIAAAGGGHLETVGAVPGALLFPPGDADACARRLVEFAAMTEAERRDYGGALRHAQRAAFDAAQHVRELDAVYRQVLP